MKNRLFQYICHGPSTFIMNDYSPSLTPGQPVHQCQNGPGKTLPLYLHGSQQEPVGYILTIVTQHQPLS